MNIVYYVAHSSLEPFYFLTNVEIQNASGWGNELFDEENLGFLGLGSPDFYFTITDESQNIIYQSNVLEEQSLLVTFSLDNLQLLNQNYTINVLKKMVYLLIMIFVVRLILKAFQIQLH